MDIFKSFASLKKANGSLAITFGNFDGLHIGHLSLFEKLLSFPTRYLITFDSDFFLKKKLTPLPHKLALLSEMGIFSACIVLTSEKIFDMSYEEFLIFLKKGTNFSDLFLGEDAVFGKNKEGSQKKIFSLENSLNFSFHPIPLKKDASGQPISSTKVRSFCEEKNFKKCSNFLGRCFEYRFDTFTKNASKNIVFDANEYVLPPTGLYLVEVFSEKQSQGKSFAKIDKESQTISLMKKPNQLHFKKSISLIPLSEIAFPFVPCSNENTLSK